jgi:hypothetical protein
MATDPRDLTTLASVQNWLNSQNQNFTTTDATTIIPGLITAASIDWLKRTGRGTLNRILPFNEFYDGSGSTRQMLRNYPCIAVSQVTANGAVIPQGSYSSSGQPQPGWVIDQERESISIIGVGCGWGNGLAYATGTNGVTGSLARTWGGWSFGSRNDSNRQNVNVQYFAGYNLQENEPGQVGTGPYTYTVLYGGAGVNFYDLGVMYALPQSGAVLAFSAVPSAPTQGQYSVSATGVYTFSAADASAYIVVSYAANGTPQDITDAVTRQVADAYKSKTYIGMKSQGNAEIGTTSYTWNIPIPVYAESVLQRYRRRALVGV